MTLTYIKSDLTNIRGGIECTALHYIDDGREPGWEYTSIGASCALVLRNLYYDLLGQDGYADEIEAIGVMLAQVDQDADARVLLGLAHISV